MRKVHKTLLLGIFNSLHEAHAEIKNLICYGSEEEAHALMAQCQETAIDIGTTIDELEGDGTAAVKYLEEYCEALYQVHEGVMPNLTGNKVFCFLEEKIYKAEKSLKNDIRTSLEIVFMPYKSSMWDSMETIWRAAQADPNCEAYVVPIPYYERNPDRSFGDFHYEGHDFPGDVPIVHYENYDLEKRTPDIIYIHNPYDNENLVTSVDPRFYSGELKKYTDMLVYVPYFVWKPFDPKDISEVNKRLPFCVSPAIKNADRVITLAGYMRDLHMRTYIRHFGDTPVIRREAEKKFLVAGSPKMDKMVSLTAENTNVPEEWLKKTNGKKVVFYNTSLTGLISYPKRYIGKMSQVFGFFENRSDCVLLWRPHPLMESTINSMTPALKNSYMSVKQRFITVGSGIFDDTPDTLKAIYLSDMIYGDVSSVCTQFEMLGLPVMYQDVCADESVLLEKWLNNNGKKQVEQPGKNYITNGEKIHRLIKEQALNS